MPLPLIPAVVIGVGLFFAARSAKRAGVKPKDIPGSFAPLVRRRSAARCLSIFQDYVLYACVNVFLLLAPILLGLVPQAAAYSVEFLAAGYVLMMCRAAYSSWAIVFEFCKYSKGVKIKKSFSAAIREMLTNIIEEEVRDEIDSKVRGLSQWLPGIRLFSKKLLEGSEAAIHTEIIRLALRIGMALITYLSITHFLSTPIMLGAGSMPWWQSCIYPFYHSVEICFTLLWSESWEAMLLMAIGLPLYSETSARVAESLRTFDRGLPAVFFVLPMLCFVFILFNAAGCSGAHIYTYFLAYLCAAKASLEAKTAGVSQ